MSAGPIVSKVLSFEDARRVVEEHASLIHPSEVESVDLLAAAGRVLAESIIADRDLPPFARSTRDGYAVRSADVLTAPVVLQLMGEIKAGERIENIPSNIEKGQAVSIMTGAPVPNGADAVVMVEYTSQNDNGVEIQRNVAEGENIVPKGAEARAGGELVARGVRLNEAAIALAASTGKSKVEVYKRPRVAVLTTGDEIVDVDAIPGFTQIRNSNSYSLSVQIQSAGGKPVILPIAPDEPKALRQLIEEGLRSELLLLTGGVSMGRYDLVEQVLSDLKAEFFFTGANIQPGRPVVFGRSPKTAADEGLKPGTFFFGLPGNPVSTMVTFELFARPILEGLAGMSSSKLKFFHVKLKSEIRVKPGLTRFLPAILSGEFGDSRVELVPWQGSGDVAATARANCYIVIAPDREQIPVDELVPIMVR